MPTSASGDLPSGTQRAPRLRECASIAKTEKSVRGVHNAKKTKRTPRAAIFDVQRSYNDALEAYTLPGVGHHGQGVWIQPLHEDRIKTFCFAPHHRKTVELDRYDHITSLLEAALIPCDHHAQVLVPKQKVLCFSSRVWKAAGVTEMS